MTLRRFGVHRRRLASAALIANLHEVAKADTLVLRSGLNAPRIL
jgi:hypothetical protein